MKPHLWRKTRKTDYCFQILDRQEEAYHPNYIPRVIPITLFLNDQSLYILGHDHSLTLIEEVFPDLMRVARRVTWCFSC